MNEDVKNSKTIKSYTSQKSVGRRSTPMVKKVKSTIFFGESNPFILENNHYPNNRITTTNYNIITFVPKSLLFQFKRAANIYFLIVSILTCMKFSPKQPSSMIGTFAFVLFCTMVKDAIQDYSRYKQDNHSNNRDVFKFSEDEWKKVKCWTLRPGDFIKIIKEEEFSADTLVIKSSNSSGYCYIDTKNLDGETNLKEKCCIEEFKDDTNNNLGIQNLQGEIHCDKPDENLMAWEGIVVFKNNNIYSNLKNIILKGCVLKNTEYVIGIVVYSGKDTKIMKNSKRPRIKTSKVLLTMNKLLYSLFALDILVCMLFGILSFIYSDKYGPRYDYLFPNYNTEVHSKKEFMTFGLNFLIFFIAYSQIIPISLYVALEVVKIMQGMLIVFDHEIYDYSKNKPASCRTTDLIEELGQVEFIFSDKTGTLTQNSMVLKKCFVNNKIYGMIQDDKEDARFTINGDISASKKITSNNKGDLRDKQMLEDFFNLLALCHNVFPEVTDKGIVYQGSSPDDIALVKGAQQLGIEYITKDFSSMQIKNHLTKETKTYEFKTEMPFSSDRKRMSVIVQEKQSGRIIMLTKGADNVMLGNANSFNETNNVSNLTTKAGVVNKFDGEFEYNEINRVLLNFSKEGLRILVMGMKYLDEKTYKSWEHLHNEERNKGRDLTRLYDQLEKEMYFVGCSAIEDKLQEGVPETIQTLLNCNIRIWVLTGDKQDTALEIAKSCQLVNENMYCLNLSCEPDVIDKKLRDIYFDLNLDYFFHPKKPADLDRISRHIKKISDQDLSLIINGETLEVILNSKELSRIFFYISVAARSVICCRVSPKQKAKVVRLAKQNGHWITLSIGDGANDVPMIMEAHIGIGIQGKEGTQAVRSADYNIGQFRYLEKLLLVYGRNGYMKITKFICYYFYKNIVLVFTELFFAFFNGYSGQIYFAEYLGTMYNAFFTSWPCLFTFALEREHDLETCKKFPILYQAGTKNYYFNFKVFWSYIIYAIIHSTLAFYLPTLGLFDIVGSNGSTFTHWHISSVSFCFIIHIVTLKLLIISNFWNIVNLTAILVSLLFYYISLVVLSSDTMALNLQNEMIGVALEVLTNIKSLIIILFGAILCVMPDIFLKQIYYNLWPTPNQRIDKHIYDRDINRGSYEKNNNKDKVENNQVKGQFFNKESTKQINMNRSNSKINVNVNDDQKRKKSINYIDNYVTNTKREIETDNSRFPFQVVNNGSFNADMVKELIKPVPIVKVFESDADSIKKPNRKLSTKLNKLKNSKKHKNSNADVDSKSIISSNKNSKKNSQKIEIINMHNLHNFNDQDFIIGNIGIKKYEGGSDIVNIVEK